MGGYACAQASADDGYSGMALLNKVEDRFGVGIKTLFRGGAGAFAIAAVVDEIDGEFAEAGLVVRYAVFDSLSIASEVDDGIFPFGVNQPASKGYIAVLQFYLLLGCGLYSLCGDVDELPLFSIEPGSRCDVSQRRNCYQCD